MPALRNEEGRESGIELCVYKRPIDEHAQTGPWQPPPVSQEQDFSRRVHRRKRQAEEKSLIAEKTLILGELKRVRPSRIADITEGQGHSPKLLYAL